MKIKITATCEVEIDEKDVESLADNCGEGAFALLQDAAADDHSKSNFEVVMKPV